MNSKLFTLVIAGVALAAFGQQKPAYSDAEAAKHVGEEATVTGKLVNVSISGTGTTFLNLGDRFPRQTFGAIIFASNQTAVGDVKQYEGKEVAITGRIEMSKDQKPEIKISRPDQIKLAGAATPPAPSAPPAPAPAPVATTTPMPTRPAPPPPPTPPVEPASGKRVGKIDLATGWESPRRGGEMARMDLAKLFGGSGSASEVTAVDTSIEVYPGVPFLTPLDTARKSLNLDGVQSSKSKVSTPGFPQDSFSATMFNGVFPGGFSRLYLVTDSDDQVVSALLVDSSSRTRVPNETDTAGYHTYNFVTGGAKATGNLMIKHEIKPAKGATGVFVVDTLLVDPNDIDNPSSSRSTKGGSSKSSSSSKPKTGKVLERSRWFVPAPVVNLILRCVGG